MSQTSAPTKPAETSETFDWDSVFGPVANKIDFAMNMCGIDNDKVDPTRHVRTMMNLKGQAELQVYWNTHRTIHNGFVTVSNSTQLDTAQKASDAMKAAARAQASADGTWQRLLHEATRPDAFRAYRAPETRIELGRVGKRFHAFEHCANCRGKGEVRCCMMGGGPCWQCHGKRQYKIYSSGTAMWVNCYQCNMTGWENCPTCGGTKRLDCGTCAATGGHTYEYSGVLHGIAASQLAYAGTKYGPEAEAFLARPRGEVMDNSFFYPPEWNTAARPYTGTLTIRTPVQRLDTTIEHLGQTHTVALSFAGRDLRWGPRHPFVDAVIEPYVQRIERSAGREAFKVADETAFAGSLIKDITHKPTPPEAVVQALHHTISPRTVERVTAALTREASRLTRRPIGRAWIQANLAALGLWAAAAALFGERIRAALPPSPTGDAYAHLMLAWIALVPALLVPAFFWSRRAACRALAEALKQPVTRAPDLGGRAALGTLGLVAIVTLAMVGFAPPGKNGTAVARTSVERSR